LCPGAVAQGYAGWPGSGNGSLVVPEARGWVALAGYVTPASALGNGTCSRARRVASPAREGSRCGAGEGLAGMVSRRREEARGGVGRGHSGGWVTMPGGSSDRPDSGGKEGGVLADLEALTPPLVVCVAFLIGVVLFLRRQMGSGSQPADPDAETDIHDDGSNADTDDPKAASSDDRGMT